MRLADRLALGKLECYEDKYLIYVMCLSSERSIKMNLLFVEKRSERKQNGIFLFRFSSVEINDTKRGAIVIEILPLRKLNFYDEIRVRRDYHRCS